MKLIRFLSPLVTMLALVVAGNAADQKGEKATTELKAQTRCPVMGGKIDSTVFTDIQGQRVFHCCPGCQEKLVADPDKYFKKAAAQGVTFENIQTVCPVTGEPFDKKILTDFEGRRVYFATEEAKATFGKDPAKYLAILDEQVKAKAASEPEKATPHSEHHGH